MKNFGKELARFYTSNPFWGKSFLEEMSDFTRSMKHFNELMENSLVGDLENESANITNEKDDIKITFPLTKEEEIKSLTNAVENGVATFTLVSETPNSKRRTTISTTVDDDYDIDGIFKKISDDNLSVDVFIPKKEKKELTFSEKLSLIRDKITAALENDGKSEEEITNELNNAISGLSTHKEEKEEEACCEKQQPVRDSKGRFTKKCE